MRDSLWAPFCSNLGLIFGFFFFFLGAEFPIGVGMEGGISIVQVSSNH